ncbi:MAG: phosphoribosylformylglycinamidine synthase subunit PurQ [Proteobacteria bacterium]|nr:phosphoribosylformylglycinamidine synthase subunit PurQ [Cystobacterineae bacterium]MCL2259374.1 phosphoribosylformylglycinamidine synthase subunit PurQ [Cystobacterineae bacterium]MCL2314173.1 phosphoribosylformylglycinamidine synthase subunit PurQ [Pseudomonadota bacterium]
MKGVGIALFPGGQLDSDIAFAMKRLGLATKVLGHMESDLGGCEVVVLPFSMSFGGYYRPGALAAQTPLAKAIKDFALEGGRVVGIGDGFAVLTELRLLPGALLPNKRAQFLSAEVRCQVVDHSHTFFQKQAPCSFLKLHVASPNANYIFPPGIAPEAARVALRFVDENGFSESGVAAVVNARGNVFGMLPIPERNLDGDGGRLLASMFC